MPKESRAGRRKGKGGHEICPGYKDVNDIWNNGFYCPRWGGANDKYCCGDATRRYCCPKPKSTEPPQQVSYIPIVIGISVVVIVLATVITLSCFFCRCCPGYKKRQKRLQKAQQQQQQQQQSHAHDLPDVAVQASGHSVHQDHDPSPVPSPVSPINPMRMPYLQHTSTCTGSPSSHSHSEVLHCGCQWSPALSHSPMADLDSIMKKLYGGSSELEPLPDYSVEKPPPYTEHDIHTFELSNKFETKTLGRRFRENKALSATAEPTKVVSRAISDPSQLCMKTFRPMLNGPRSEEAKRDSGVLVEEGELSEAAPDANVAYVLPSFHPQPVLRSPAFLGYNSSQSSLELDSSDFKATVHSQPDIDMRS